MSRSGNHNWRRRWRRLVWTAWAVKAARPSHGQWGRRRPAWRSGSCRRRASSRCLAMRRVHRRRWHWRSVRGSQIRSPGGPQEMRPDGPPSRKASRVSGRPGPPRAKRPRRCSRPPSRPRVPGPLPFARCGCPCSNACSGTPEQPLNTRDDSPWSIMHALLGGGAETPNSASEGREGSGAARPVGC